MEHGSLSEYFEGVAAKKLSRVETDGNISHQRELNGSAELRKILGTPDGKAHFETTFMYLCDDDAEPIHDEGSLTWYDARAKNPTRTEWRCYYSPNSVMDVAEEGDDLVLALKRDGTILAIVTEQGTDIASQIKWLFGVEARPEGFVATTDLDVDTRAWAARVVLREIGILETGEELAGAVEDMESRFGQGFPTTREFSDYARSTLIDLYPGDDGDEAIVAWMEREDTLFKMFEDHLISQRIHDGFEQTDDFIQYALSTLNRRKSRAGQALENHLCALFDHREVEYSHGKVTENRSKPDFMLPSIEKYRDPGFPAALLTMLGAKTTLKDRWRQVLAEADRIEEKHLVTLQPAISENQTVEMQSHHLRLVVPKAIQSTYTPAQQEWLMSMDEFIDHAHVNQRAARRI
jgi:hypothetical protein